MKKILLQISSAVLGLATGLTAFAAGPMPGIKASPSRFGQHEVHEAPAQQRTLPLIQNICSKQDVPQGKGLYRSYSNIRPVVVERKQASASKAPSRLAPGSLPALRGMLVAGNTLQSNAVGLYDLSPEGNTLFLKGPCTQAGIEVDGVYYTHYYGEDWFGSGYIATISGYDLQTGDQVYSGMNTSPTQGAIAGLAKDPTDGKVYGITFNNNSEALQLTTFEYYPTYIAANKVADIDETFNYNSIACDNDGQLYAIAFDADGTQDSFTVTSSSLYKLDKQTGTMTLVGETGQLPQGISSATIDAASNRMFWTVYTLEGEGYMCEVDLTTGAATKLYDFTDDEQVTGLCVPEPVAKAGAPAQPTDFTIDFPRGAFEGTVSFKIPAMTYDGTPASGAVNYVVTCGNNKKEGTANYGETVSEPCAVTYATNYKFEAYLYNEVGKSPKVFDKVFVGRGVPRTPVVTLEREDNNVTLSWEPVVDSSDGGFIDPDSVVYVVRRYVNEIPEIIADSIAGCSVTDVIANSESPMTIYYTVQSVASIKSSAEGKTEGLYSGAITIDGRYSNDFATADRFGGFRVIDANGDGKTWELYNSYGTVDVRCNYSYTTPKDDWLISPAINFKAGKVYRIGMSLKCNNYGRSPLESLDIVWGTEPTIESLDREVLKGISFCSYKYSEYGGLVIPEADGQYYFAVHATSNPRTSYYIYVDDIYIEEVDMSLLPGVVTDLEAVADPTGALEATLTFKAPSLNLEGNTLESLSHIVVKRDNVVVTTFTDVTPGQTLEYTDKVSVAGYANYTVQAFTETGGGKEVAVRLYVGVNRPASPTNVKMEETANWGEARFTWDAVTTDVDGAPLNPDFITYSICIPVDLGYAVYYNPVYEGITGTEFVTRICEPDNPTFVQYLVCAKTTGGFSTGVDTGLKAFGKPYTSVHDSFEGGSATYAFSSTGYDGSLWELANDEMFNGLTSVDDDNGFLFMGVNYIDYYAELTTAKIRLPAIAPAIQLYVFNFQAAFEYEYNNILDIYIREVGEKDFTKLTSGIKISELPATASGWAPCSVSLAGYEGKTVQVRVRGMAVNDAYIMIDNITIGRILEKDATVEVSAPASVHAGDEFSAIVSVGNRGLETLGEMEVKLYADGKEIATGSVSGVLPGTDTKLSFPVTMRALAELPMALVATVSLPGDLDLSNNTSAVTAVSPKLSLYPAITDLEGHVGESGDVELAWSRPDLTSSPAVATSDGFEDAQAFDTAYGDWVFVDVDGEPSAGLQGVLMPVEQTPQSFWVLDRDWSEYFNDTFNAHSGKKYLASICTWTGKPCNDWAITPALTGQAQEVSFYAKSFHPDYPERMQVYYSEGSTDPGDFTIVLDRIIVPNEWTKYVVDLPAGAKRMAIRKCTISGFMLFVDDVQFAREGAEPNTNIIGYEVYRNGEAATGSLVELTSWTDKEVLDGEYEYAVVTVYDQGKSRASNAVTVSVETSGIEIVTVDADAEYFNLQGMRVDRPVSGRVYICRKGTHASKVIIR